MMSSWCRYSSASNTWPSMFCIHWGKSERCHDWRGSPGSWLRQVGDPSKQPAGSWIVLSLLLQMDPKLKKSSEPVQEISASGPFQAKVRGALQTGQACQPGQRPRLQTPHSCPHTGDTPTWAPPLVGIRDMEAFIAYLGLASVCH